MYTGEYNTFDFGGYSKGLKTWDINLGFGVSPRPIVIFIYNLIKYSLNPCKNYNYILCVSASHSIVTDTPIQKLEIITIQ